MPKQLHVPFAVFVEWLLPLNIDAAFGLELQAYPSGSQVHQSHALLLKHRLSLALVSTPLPCYQAAVQLSLAVIMPMLPVY